MASRKGAARGQAVTLAQVAASAGVSLATASRVLNGSGGRTVGAAMQEKVLSSAAVLSYAPNSHAQALAGGGAPTVGLVIHDISDPYFAAITRGAMQVAMEHDLLVLLASTMGDPNREIAYVRALRSQRPKAIVLCGSGFNSSSYSRGMTAMLKPFRDIGGRVAVVSHHDLAVDAVAPDNRGGAELMGREFGRLGHRRVALLAGSATLTTISHRIEGFRTGLRAGGVKRPPRVLYADFSEEGGYQGARALLDDSLTETAVFCVNDVMAMGALMAFRQAGVRVPEDVSLAGFDDIDIVSRLTPSLTTVRLPLEEMGREAMTMVLEPVRRTRRTINVAAELVSRDSTAGPRMSKLKGIGR
jgi:LacI family transcriptional regulator